MSEYIFVTCLLEASLALATEWPHVLADYITPLLQRICDGHSSQCRLATISYSTADYRPNPILSKQLLPLSNQQMPPPRLREPHELGLGQAGPGAGYGTAALEGIVAALEVSP